MTHNPLVYWSRERQNWAIEQERMRHTEALWQFGELAYFALMWHLEDFQAGLVQRCQRCYVTQGKIAKAYGQGNQYDCPDCFGTTFEGGFKAVIIRPTIFGDTDKDQKSHSRGIANADEVDIESTSDFRIRTGDYCFRETGDRFYLRVPQRVTLRSGFGTPWMTTTAITYSHARAVIEDPSNVSYIIPPDNTTVTQILSAAAQSPWPVDLSPHETIRAPLIPETVPAVELEEPDVSEIVRVEGPQGPAGPKGDPGPTGGTYIHQQVTPSTTWTIDHNLGFDPAGIRIVTSGGSELEGAVTYTSPNQVVVTFSTAFSGTAYLS